MGLNLFNITKVAAIDQYITGPISEVQSYGLLKSTEFCYLTK